MTSTVVQTDIDTTSVNTIRTLCMDAVQAANSGHPGTPMAMAPVVYELWQNHLSFDPSDPIWPNRDRFVLSMGHASTLLYSILHLTNVQAVDAKYETVGQPSVALEDLKKFRQLDSKCPGHPEYRWTSGIECTTGPLGTGFATSVGMAISSKWLAANYNKPGHEMFNFNVYALGGDGCMMEGVASEAASLAAHLQLDNLCWIYDNNKITIEGSTDVAFTEDVATRFVGYGWNVQRVGDANDLKMLARAFNTFKRETGRPTLIIVDSHIAYGAPTKQDHHSAHGEPLGVEEIAGTKRFYGFPPDEQFFVPDGVYDNFANGIGQRGRSEREAWESAFEEYRKDFPELANQLELMQTRDLPEGWDKDLPVYPADAKGVASRQSSGEVLNALAKNYPWLIGGSADLAPSTKTYMKGLGDFQADNYAGRNLHFGVREFAAGTVTNGLAVSKIRPFWSGFMIFSDFARGAIRLSAIMEIPTIHIFTHDSIGVGEDGPTHQPVEQLLSLRAIPGLMVIRPADANEVVEAWRLIAGVKHEPVALILSRQNLPTLDREVYAPASGLAKGAYVLASADDPEIVLMATGSEVDLVVKAYEQLTSEGVRARVVSMPCLEIFEQQSPEYRDSVLPPNVRARVAVEQASTHGWHRYVGLDGAVIGMETFGASAPLKELLTKFGFTPDKVVSTAREVLERNR